MSQRKTLFSFCLVLIAFGVLSVTLACGGGSSQSSPALSQAQVQAMTSEMQSGLVSAAGTSTGGPCAGGTENQFCFDTTVNCSGGGSISISARMTDNLDANGTGQSSYDVILIPRNCSVRNENLVLNGDPSLKFTGTVNVMNWQEMNLTGTETGTVSYGPNPQGVCESNLTLTALLEPTLTCSIKGTQCGQPVDFTCPQQ